VLIGAMFGSAQPVLLAFPAERPVFLREYRTGTYGTFPYFLSKTVVELVMSFLTMLVAVVVSYYLIDFRGPLMYHVLVAWGLAIVASSVALLLGCAVKDVTLALELTPLVFVPQIMFSGFFIKMEDIPVWLRWAQYLCSLKFAVNLGLLAEFGGEAGCPRSNSSVVMNKSENAMNRCLASAKLLEQNDIYPEDWWVYTLVLIALFVGFRALAAVLLAAKAK
jgi:hypothetical protein